MASELTNIPSFNIEQEHGRDKDSRPIDWFLNDDSAKALLSNGQRLQFQDALYRLRVYRYADPDRAQQLILKLDELAVRSLGKEITKISPEWDRYESLPEIGDSRRGEYVNPIALDDGRIFLGGDGIASTGILDPENNFEFTPTPRAPYSSFSYAQQGNKIAALAGADEFLGIEEWNAVSGETRKIEFEGDSAQSGLDYLPDGRLFTGLEDGTILVCNLNDKENPVKQVFETDVPIEWGSHDVTSDGKIVVGGSTRNIVIIDPLRGPERQQWLTIPTDSRVASLKALSDGRIVALVDSMICFWDGATGKLLKEIPNQYDSHILQLGHDETIIIGCSAPPDEQIPELNDGIIDPISAPIFLLDAHNYEMKKELAGHSSSIFAMTVLPDNRIVSSDAKGFLKLWGMR